MLRFIRLLAIVSCFASSTGCYVDHRGARDGSGDGGAVSTQYVYENVCRAVYDYFLVDERPDRCLIAAFPDRFPPMTSSVESARVVRGASPCPAGGAMRPGFVDSEVTVDVEVRTDGDALVARLTGSFPDGDRFDVPFRSADRRPCCDCGRSWP